MREVGKLVIILSLICGISVGLLQMVRTGLAAKIEQQQDFYLRGPSLEELFEDNAAQLLGNKFYTTVDGESIPVFFDKNDAGELCVGIEAAGVGGYGGNIQVMMVFNTVTGTLNGLEIIDHSETPGIGAKIVDDAFEEQWDGKPLINEFKLRNDGGNIDGVTGASYSSKAVIDGCNKVIRIYQQLDISSIHKKLEEK